MIDMYFCFIELLRIRGVTSYHTGRSKGREKHTIRAMLYSISCRLSGLWTLLDIFLQQTYETVRWQHKASWPGYAAPITVYTIYIILYPYYCPLLYEHENGFLSNTTWLRIIFSAYARNWVDDTSTRINVNLRFDCYLVHQPFCGTRALGSF